MCGYELYEIYIILLYHINQIKPKNCTVLVPQFPLIIIGSLICQNSYNIECMYIVDLEIANKISICHQKTIIRV